MGIESHVIYFRRNVSDVMKQRKTQEWGLKASSTCQCKVCIHTEAKKDPRMGIESLQKQYDLLYLLVLKQRKTQEWGLKALRHP